MSSQDDDATSIGESEKRKESLNPEEGEEEEDDAKKPASRQDDESVRESEKEEESSEEGEKEEEEGLEKSKESEDLARKPSARKEDEIVYESEEEEGSPEEDDDGEEAEGSQSENQDARQGMENPRPPKKRKRKSKPPGYYDEIVDKPDKNAYKGPKVNWNTMAGRKWASEPLLKFLPHPEVNNLIGWAHYGTHNGSALLNEDFPEGNFQQQRPKAAFNKEQEPNPLLEVEPDGPLPLSHLDYLQEKARDLVRGKRENRNVSQAKVRDESLACILGKFDTSASLALGMVLEEMVTANLLPLAEAHVQRCRQLEVEEEAHELELKTVQSALPSNHERQSFHDWTLPPEEAIFNVMVSSLSSESSVAPDANGRGYLPSTCPPTRTASLVAPSQESIDNDDGDTDPKKQVAANFCQRQGLKSRFVRKNMDVFQWFLPTAPPDMGDHLPNKRKAFDRRKWYDKLPDFLAQKEKEEKEKALEKQRKKEARKMKKEEAERKRKKEEEQKKQTAAKEKQQQEPEDEENIEDPEEEQHDEENVEASVQHDNIEVPAQEDNVGDNADDSEAEAQEDAEDEVPQEAEPSTNSTTDSN